MVGDVDLAALILERSSSETHIFLEWPKLLKNYLRAGQSAYTVTILDFLVRKEVDFVWYTRLNASWWEYIRPYTDHQGFRQVVDMEDYMIHAIEAKDIEFINKFAGDKSFSRYSRNRFASKCRENNMEKEAEMFKRRAEEPCPKIFYNINEVSTGKMIYIYSIGPIVVLVVVVVYHFFPRMIICLNRGKPKTILV